MNNWYMWKIMDILIETKRSKSLYLKIILKLVSIIKCELKIKDKNMNPGM